MVGDELLALFGPEFGAGFMTMVILGLSQIAYAAMGSGDTILIMSGRPCLNLINTIGVVVVNFALNLWLVPELGMLGAAVGTLISFMILTLIRLVEVYHLYRIHPLAWRLWKPLAAAGFVFCAVFFGAEYLPDTAWFRIIAQPAMFLTGYLLVLSALGLEETDRSVLRRVRNWLPFNR